MQSIKNIIRFAEHGIDHIASVPAEMVQPADVVAMGELADMLKDAIEAKYHYMELKKEHGYDMEMGHDHTMPDHDEWGDAHPEAQRLFEELEHHYMGYWKYVAMHQKTGCAMSKGKMLDHFKHMLVAHDNMAAFTKGNCPSACPEIRAILMEWINKKAA